MLKSLIEGYEAIDTIAQTAKKVRGAEKGVIEITRTVVRANVYVVEKALADELVGEGRPCYGNVGAGEANEKRRAAAGVANRLVLPCHRNKK